MSVCSCRVLIHVLCQFYMNPPENNHLIFESSFYLVKLDSFITEMGKWVTCVRRGVHLFQNWAFKVGQNEYILMGDDYCIHTKGTSTTSDVFYEPWLQNEKHTPFCCTWRESASINFLSDLIPYEILPAFNNHFIIRPICCHLFYFISLCLVQNRMQYTDIPAC